MIEINYIILLILIIYISSINKNNIKYYNLIIFNLFENIFIKLIILFFIFVYANNYVNLKCINTNSCLNISILLTISYILTNEYMNYYNIYIINNLLYKKNIYL